MRGSVASRRSRSRTCAARRFRSKHALNRRACTIDVEGLDQVEAGDRIVINPAGRAHTYGVTAVGTADASTHRLSLDMASIHGRARIASIEGHRLDLDFFLIPRTATLHGTRLQREMDDAWQPIVHAANDDGYTTRVDLEAPLAKAKPGDWVSAVDYVIGDVLRLEKQYTHGTAMEHSAP